MVVSVIGLSITAYLSFTYAEEILKQKQGEQLFGESRVRGETIRLLFESRIEQNQILANDPMIRILTAELNQIPDKNFEKIREEKRRIFLTQVQAFQELVGYTIGFEDVKIIGRDGKLLFTLGKVTNTNFLNDPLFNKGLTKSFVDFEPASIGKKMIIVSPIFSEDDKLEDEPIGVIISRMRTTALDNILTNRSGLGETGEVYIVNDGFLMLSESRFIDDVVFKQKVNTIPVQECFRAGKEHIGFYPDYRGVEIYGSSYCANDLGLVLLAEIDEAEVVQPVLILQNKLFQIGILITTGMAIIAFVISKTLSRPLIKLKIAANKLADGNFDVRTKINTGDEIGELSFAFDAMAQKLQDSLIEIKQKEDVIKKQEDILLQFSDYSENYCVCMIDIINSTKITSSLSESQTSEFYQTFLNSIAKIIRKFDGIVVKNIGDALLFYFPVIHSEQKFTLNKCLECCMTILESHNYISNQLKQKKLPEFDYRISATYGIVRIAKTSTSSVNDIFGSTVNRCAKINRLAPPNGFVIGETFYKTAKTIDEFVFKEIKPDIPSEHEYGTYLVTRKKIEELD